MSVTEMPTANAGSVKPARLIQYFTALSVTMGALSFGTSIGFTSPAGPMMNETLSGEEEMMWFNSIINMGAMAGGPMGGLLINVVGRKGSMLGSVVLSLSAWLLIIFGRNFASLLSGRIIGGLFMGMTSLVVPTYIGEMASADIRGALGSGFQLMVVIGILYAYLFGAVIDNWRVLAVVCAVPVAIYGVLAFFVKESPTYLLSKGKEKEAREALQALRGKEYNIESEFKMLRETQEALTRNQVTWRDLMQPHILKPVIICLLVMVFQQSSGVNAVLFNLGTIFKEAGVGLPENISAIVVGAVQVVATGIAAPLLDRAGRKILLTGSAAVMALSHIALGVFFYLKEEGEAPGWLPLTSLMVFIAAFSLGYGPIPWVLMGEMFSLEVRAPASGLATLTNWSVSFIVTLAYDPMKMAMHEYGAFWFFGGVCTVSTLFCIFVVPETKGKTVQEISAYFGGPAVTQSQEKPANEERRTEVV
uniref:Major facilitator superfamily (MFS) profile domain-containing protein n=2 Tax=Scylla olivacea TaxID=85551 RepID=A0A0N7ZAW5_SCYOL